MAGKLTFTYGLLLTSSLILAGCGLMEPWGGGTKVRTSEDLLAAEGSWNLVEEKRVPSPAQQHAMARNEVNPDQMQNSSYTSQNRPQMMASGEDIHFRLLRMEREVQSLRADFNKLLPPLKQLLISDARLQQAISEVEKARGMPPSSYSSQTPPPMKAASAVRPSPSHSSYKPPASSGGPGVQGVRIGEHPGKVRVVLDMKGPGTFSYDIDNNEKLLVVELPSTPWSAARSQRFKNNPLIAGYSVSDNGSGGSVLVLELKRAAKVVESTTLAPNAVYGNRIMIDVAGL